MTPSKEALSAARAVDRASNLHLPRTSMHSGTIVDIAIIIDTAFAEHRERVAALVRAAREASGEIRSLPHKQWLDRLDAALAPFLEQETPTT